MITSALLYIAYGFVYIVTSPLRLLPDASLPAEVASTIATINGYLSSFTPFLPMGTLITILLSVISIEVFIFSYKVIMWVIRRFPTQS